MAATESPGRAHDRLARKRPFANWMKRLANLKSSHTDSSQTNSHRSPYNSIRSKKRAGNPHQISQEQQNNATQFLNPPPHTGQTSQSRHSSLSHSKVSFSHDGLSHPKSRAPTLATTAETTVSGTGTIATTTGRTEGDRDSTFSSPAPSLRSITTTLTTMQSTAPGAAPGIQTNPATPTTNAAQPATTTTTTTHLAPTGHPVTYQSATANNVLTDDASILTLASSTKRRRRNSVDSKASIRALAPASMFGGSRESLPLSVLSGTVINPGGGYTDTISLRETTSLYYPRSTSAMNAERASLISVSGIAAPALASDRNSYMSTNRNAGDSGSVRSGLLGLDREGAASRAERLPLHGRNDSLGGASIGASSLLGNQREPNMITAPTSPMAL